MNTWMCIDDANRKRVDTFLQNYSTKHSAATRGESPSSIRKHKLLVLLHFFFLNLHLSSLVYLTFNYSDIHIFTSRNWSELQHHIPSICQFKVWLYLLVGIIIKEWNNISFGIENMDEENYQSSSRPTANSWTIGKAGVLIIESNWVCTSEFRCTFRSNTRGIT
jgi:hypothetical protein